MSAEFGRVLVTLVPSVNGGHSLVLYRNKEWEEYVAVVYYGPLRNRVVVATYHTDDLDDADITGRNELDHCIKNNITKPLAVNLW